MPQIDREGIFKTAAGAQHGLEEQKNSKSVAVAINFQITDKLEGSEWQNWGEYGYHAWARVWLIKADGTVNENAVKTLRDVLGWDGDLDSIGSDKWSLPACQITVKGEAYGSQLRHKVDYINPIDYSPGPRTAPAEKVQSLKTVYGSQIRALFGNQQIKTPAPAKKPAPMPPLRPASMATLPPPPPAAKGVHGTKQRAWVAFVEANAAIANPRSDAVLAKEWDHVFSQFFGDRDESSLTPQDWVRMETDGPAEMTPF
jgi:hypothetical protein